MSLRLTVITALALVLPAASLIPAGQAPVTCPGDTTPDFTDACHHEYLLYDVDYEPDVDVLIMPSASPYALRDSILIENSVAMWDAGINALGPAWLASGINLHYYSVGLDYVPDEAWWDPEIVIIPAEVIPLVGAGIGEQFPYGLCHGLPPPTSWLGYDLPELASVIPTLPGFHEHETASGASMGVLTTSCDSGGTVCFVIETNSLVTPSFDNMRDMFDLNSHELGHCLGVGHVGDALDFTAAVYPRDDIMSYALDGHNPAYALCVSNLNIDALKMVYGNLRGQTGYPASVAGGFVHRDPATWAAHACTQPTAVSAVNLTPILTADPLGPLGPP